MAKIVIWDESTAKKELKKRLGYAKDSRKREEEHWQENYKAVYSTSSSADSSLSQSFESDIGFGLADIDNSSPGMNTSYAFKNFRFIHAQLSANPPSVVVRPASNDQEDRRKSDAADRIVRHGIRHYSLQEKIDQASLQCLLYGSGVLKTIWDSETGDILEFDEESGDITLEGDISFTVPSTWNIFFDPDATTVDELRYVFERVWMPYEEALFRWPEYEKLLEQARTNKDGNPDTRATGVNNNKYDSVELYQYWEKGLPTNGYLGRFCFTTKEGEVLGEVKPSPFRFVSPGAVAKIDNDEDLSDDEKEAKIEKLPKIAQLPYHVFTDIDVPNRIWGKSFVEYISDLQDNLNRLDATNLDNIQAHGVNRLVLPEGTEVMDDALTNTPWDIIKITGSQPPHFFHAPGPMPLVDNFRAQIKVGIDDMAGVNESMFGQQSREQSGFSMQYATNQGNMIRRRLFNKYVIFVENVYKSYLSLVRKHWSTARTIRLIGKEKAVEAVDIKGADIDGGFDLVVEYGQSLSLDPMTRREEIMALQPMFEKAGIPTKVILQMMKLNELDGMYDINQMSEDRQREVFEEMIATGRYIPPRKLQAHEDMLAYGLRYFMTAEFKYLAPELQDLCERHITERASMAAAEKQGLAAPGTPPGRPGTPGPLPADAGMMDEQAAVGQVPELVNG